MKKLQNNLMFLVVVGLSLLNKHSHTSESKPTLPSKSLYSTSKDHLNQEIERALNWIKTNPKEAAAALVSLLSATEYARRLQKENKELRGLAVRELNEPGQ